MVKRVVGRGAQVASRESGLLSWNEHRESHVALPLDVDLRCHLTLDVGGLYRVRCLDCRLRRDHPYSQVAICLTCDIIDGICHVRDYLIERVDGLLSSPSRR